MPVEIVSTDRQLLKFYEDSKTAARYQAVRKYFIEKRTALEKELQKPITEELEFDFSKDTRYSDFRTGVAAAFEPSIWSQIKASLDIKASESSFAVVLQQLSRVAMRALEGKVISKNQRASLTEIGFNRDDFLEKIRADVARLRNKHPISMLDAQKRINFLNQLPSAGEDIRGYIQTQLAKQTPHAQIIYNILLAQQLNKPKTFPWFKKKKDLSYLKEEALACLAKFKLTSEAVRSIATSFQGLKTDSQKNEHIAELNASISRGPDADRAVAYLKSRCVLEKYIQQKMENIQTLDTRIHSEGAEQVPNVVVPLSQADQEIFNSIIGIAAPIPVPTRPVENTEVALAYEVSRKFNKFLTAHRARSTLDNIQRALTDEASFLSGVAILDWSEKVSALKKTIEAHKPKIVLTNSAKKSAKLHDEFILEINKVQKKLYKKRTEYRKKHHLGAYQVIVDHYPESRSFRDFLYKRSTVELICTLEEQLHSGDPRNLARLFKNIREIAEREVSIGYGYKSSREALVKFMDLLSERERYGQAHCLLNKPCWGKDDLEFALSVKAQDNQALLDKILAHAHLALSFTPEKFNEIHRKLLRVGETKAQLILRLASDLNAADLVDKFCEFSDQLNDAEMRDLNDKLKTEFSKNRLREQDLLLLIDKLKARFGFDFQDLLLLHLGGLSKETLKELEDRFEKDSVCHLQIKAYLELYDFESSKKIDNQKWKLFLKKNGFLENSPRVAKLNVRIKTQKIRVQFVEFSESTESPLMGGFIQLQLLIQELPQQERYQFNKELLAVAVNLPSQDVPFKAALIRFYEAIRPSPKMDDPFKAVRYSSSQEKEFFDGIDQLLKSSGSIDRSSNPYLIFQDLKNDFLKHGVRDLEACCVLLETIEPFYAQANEKSRKGDTLFFSELNDFKAEINRVRLGLEFQKNIRVFSTGLSVSEAGYQFDELLRCHGNAQALLDQEVFDALESSMMRSILEFLRSIDKDKLVKHRKHLLDFLPKIKGLKNEINHPTHSKQVLSLVDVLLNFVSEARHDQQRSSAASSAGLFGVAPSSPVSFDKFKALSDAYREDKSEQNLSALLGQFDLHTHDINRHALQAEALQRCLASGDLSGANKARVRSLIKNIYDICFVGQGDRDRRLSLIFEYTSTFEMADEKFQTSHISDASKTTFIQDEYKAAKESNNREVKGIINRLFRSNVTLEKPVVNELPESMRSGSGDLEREAIKRMVIYRACKF